MNFIIKLVIERVFRQALTAIGGVLVVSQEDQSKLIGAASMLIAFVWSIVKAYGEKKAQDQIDRSALARAASKASMIAICLIPLVGCVQTKLKSPSGWEASRTAFGINATVGEVSVDASSQTNGATTWKAAMKGYQSDSAQAIEAVARGVASGLNPSPVK